MAAPTHNPLDEFRSIILSTNDAKESTLNPSLLQTLLNRILSHPKIHCGFSDILKMPPVVETLEKMSPEKREATVRTVELFAWGTIREYREWTKKSTEEGREKVWKLTDAQVEKLTMLSVVSLVRTQVDRFYAKRLQSEGDAAGGPGGGGSEGDAAMKTESSAPVHPPSSRRAKSKRNKKSRKGSSRDNDCDDNLLSIPYSMLAPELGIPNDSDETYSDENHMRQLEDLLIECIYSNLLSAKLDQQSKSLRIQPHIPLLPDHLLSSSSAAAGVGDNEASSGSGATSGYDGSHGEGGGIYGSIFSRDINTSTGNDIPHMIHTLEKFLSKSQALLATLESCSEASRKIRLEDDTRWREVDRVLEESQIKSGAASGMSGASGSMGGISSSTGGGVGSGLARAMGVMGSGSSGSDPMEAMEMASGGGESTTSSGRRQVKRSKGGHSAMMGGRF